MLQISSFYISLADCLGIEDTNLGKFGFSLHDCPHIWSKNILHNTKSHMIVVLNKCNQKITASPKRSTVNNISSFVAVKQEMLMLEN